MTEEARQRIEELQKNKRGIIFRNTLLFFTSMTTLLMAMVLYFVLGDIERETNVYVQEAQETVKGACRAAQGEVLPANIEEGCEAARRGELPQQLQSIVDNPDPNDPEFQDEERQEGESQEPEVQDPETQDPESQDPEAPDTEENDPEVDDPEIQEEENQEGEIQEPEIQEPEEQGAPVCATGYTQKTFHYFGPDGVDNTGDEQDWLLCVKDQ